jgi:lysophospholipase L1-like esterase
MIGLGSIMKGLVWGHRESRETRRPSAARWLVGACATFALALAPVAALLAASPAQSVAAPACTPHWVTSWAASPSDGSVSPLLNQTLRMIVAPHLGGGTIRLHLTNRFGLLPVTLGPVTVGVRASGAALVPGSARAVTFGGKTSVTIPAASDVVSDPVNVSFTAFQDLAVSVYVPVAVVNPTEHLMTAQTNYLSATLSGDHTSDTSGSAFSATTVSTVSNGWEFLDGIDVLAPGSAGTVVALGDSITDGYQATLGGTEVSAHVDVDGRYPDDLERRLIAAKVPLSVVDEGISGNRLLASSSSLVLGGPSGLARFGIDALAQSGVTDVIVLEGINDIGGGAGADQLIAGYEQLIAQAHAAGVRIQLGTITPSGGSIEASYGDATANAVRQQVNQWIRTQSLADGVIDFDAAVRDPGNPSQLDPAYDGGDHVHLDLAGYRALANAVNLDSLARPGCTTPVPVAHVRVSARSGRSPRFSLRWSATDSGGPGVAYYTVEVQNRRRWQTLSGYGATSRSTGTFAAQRGKTYRFRVRATDSAGATGGWATTPSVKAR